ncbi:EAL domain-containing protein [Microtetraspora fusca]|uniref:EAL domain-containing protein n=1 Tax=Microtetraspora fusca TaxID=1997 RepID=UPI001FDFE873|nr:EAL domain-containing protein [Microtetraspora fusca]
MSVPLPFAAPPAQAAPDAPAPGSSGAHPRAPGHPPTPVFVPIVDLDTGGVVAVEVNAGDVPGLPPSDVSGTVRGLLAASRAAALLPLVLPIPARAVIGGSAGLAPLHEAVRVSGRRSRELILVIEGEVPEADRRALLAGIDGLRAAGYLIAFGGLGSAPLPLDLLADASPYVVVLARDLVDRVPRDPRRSALAESLVGVARSLGVHVLAPGLRDEAQLSATRGWGIRLAQGPLLAPIDWKPSAGRVRVRVPLPVPDTVHPGALLGPRVQELLLPGVTLSAEATAEEVVGAFGSEPSISSVILVDEYQRPVGSADRSRFLLFMAGAYGHALHAKKPARRIADAPRTVPRTTPAIAAMQLAGRDASRVYDDLVVVDEVGRCMGIVRVGDLIRNVAGLRSAR